LAKGSVGKVVARTLKTAPGVLVKLNWNEPLGRILALVRVGGRGIGPSPAPYNSALAREYGEIL
jgi:hypothetical protein